MLLCFDTETTGLPIWNQPSESPGQPHIVQLAAVLRSFNRADEPIKIMDMIVKPDGWVIPDDISQIHGITTERALAEGKPINEVLDEFVKMLAEATKVIGYSMAFDKRMVRIQEKRRYGPDQADTDLPCGQWMEAVENIELAHKMTKHCNLAPTDKMMAAGRKTSKTPKLGEAFEHCYPGKKLEGNLHNALTDIKATMAVYWWLFDKGEV